MSEFGQGESPQSIDELLDIDGPIHSQLHGDCPLTNAQSDLNCALRGV